MPYLDEVLIRLRRDYSKDEVVTFALKTVSDLQVEIGKLKSYIAELEDNPINQNLIEENKKLAAKANSLQIENRKIKEKMPTPHHKLLEENKKLKEENHKKGEINKSQEKQIVEFRRVCKERGILLKQLNPNIKL